MYEPLKPCPFCGSDNLMQTKGLGADQRAYVSCRGCHMRGPHYYSRGKVGYSRRGWNALHRPAHSSTSETEGEP